MKTWVAEEAKKPRCKDYVVDATLFLVDHVWPLKKAVTVVDTEKGVYPHALVEWWSDQKNLKTDALTHERITVVVCWIMYVALVCRTWT